MPITLLSKPIPSRFFLFMINSSENLLGLNLLISMSLPKYFNKSGLQILSSIALLITSLLTEKITSEYLAVNLCKEVKSFLWSQRMSGERSNPCKVSIIIGTPANFAASCAYISGFGVWVWTMSERGENDLLLNLIIFTLMPFCSMLLTHFPSEQIAETSYPCFCKNFSC